MSKALVELMKRQFPEAVLEVHAQHGDDTVVVDPKHWVDICRVLRDRPEAAMDMLSDLTAVDFPDREPRFEVVAHLYSLKKGHRLRLKARVGDAEGEGAEIGRGLTAYGHEEAKAIIGRKSGEIAGILGYLGRPELIHRDDMTLHRKG